MEINLKKNKRCFPANATFFSLFSLCWISYLLNSKWGCSNVKAEPGTHPPPASFLLALLVSLLPLPRSSASYLFLEFFLSLYATSLCTPSLPLVPILSCYFIFTLFFCPHWLLRHCLLSFSHTNLHSSIKPIYSRSTSSQGSSCKTPSVWWEFP